MKKFIKNIFVLFLLDRVLGYALRTGVLSRNFERLAPNPENYRGRGPRSIRKGSFSVDLDLSDLSDWKVYFRYVDRKRDWLYKKIQPNWIIYEIGSHRGWVGLNLASATGPGGKLFAFDALKNNVDITNARFSQQGFHWAKALHYAISHESGFCTLDSPHPENTASWHATKSSTGVRCEPIHIISSNENLPNPDLIKITVNGAELNVLRGVDFSKYPSMPSLMLEIGDLNLRKYNSTANELFRFLRDKKYSIFYLSQQGSLVDLTEDACGYGCLYDVWCLPQV